MAHPLFVIFFTVLASTIFLAVNATNVTEDEPISCSSNFVSDAPSAQPVDTPFKFPSAIPGWSPSPDGGFGGGVMDLGGLQVRAVTTFNKVWTAYNGGEDDTGATFFDPAEVPSGFSMLASYAQPNNHALFGSILVAKAVDPSALNPPTGYSLIWTTQCSDVTRRDLDVFFWEPVCADGYSAVGHLVTTDPFVPPLDKVQCVSSAFTTQAQIQDVLWFGDGDEDRNTTGLHVFKLWPTSPMPSSLGVPVGSFWGAPDGSQDSASLTSLVCLKNNNNVNNSMPNLNQIGELMGSYAPSISLHPDEKYMPGSVSWYFTRVRLFSRDITISEAAIIQPNGTNLPSGGSDDGLYWLGSVMADRDTVKAGNLSSVQVYVQAKPMLGGSTTYLTMWVFYAFKGVTKLRIGKIGFLKRVSLGSAGSHLGDWKHVTLAVRNLDGVLTEAFYGANGGGRWVQPWEMEFSNGTTNKPVAYAAQDGHGFYPAEGTYVKGNHGVGVRSDVKKGGTVIDTAPIYMLIAADHLGLTLPPWVQYLRRYGPSTTNTIATLLEKIEGFLPGVFKVEIEFIKLLLKLLPPEVLGAGGMAPKGHRSWFGDEDASWDDKLV